MSSGESVALFSIVPRGELIPLLTGDWKIVVNGKEGVLGIATADANGNVVGRLTITSVTLLDPTLLDILGFWNEPSQALTFQWLDRSVLFTGYQSQDQPSEPGRDIVHRLAGFCTVPPNQGLTRDTVNLIFGATARRHEFGWFAQATEAV